MTLGLGAYANFQGWNAAQAEAFLRLFQAPPDLALCMFAPRIAEGLRRINPRAYVILRWDDGDDGAQCGPTGWYGDMAAAVAHVKGLIRLRLADVAPGVYQAVMGPCEYWAPPSEPGKLDWRASFEYQLCKFVQDELGLDYVALNVPVGNLEPQDVGRFTPVLREARWLGCHLYLGPGRNSLEQETDPWYSNRPWDLWLPAFRRATLPMRLLATEMGTYESWGKSGLDIYAAARLCVELEARWRARCARENVEWGGGIPFAFGTVGTMVDWRLDGAEGAFGQEMHGGAPGGGVVPAPPEPPLPAGGDEVSTDELLRWAADVWRRAGVPFNPDAAIARYWLDSARRGRYLGRPEGPEHPSESGVPYQEFAGAVLSYRAGQVSESLPF